MTGAYIFFTITAALFVSLQEWELRVIRRRLDALQRYAELIDANQEELEQRVFDPIAKDQAHD